MHLLRTGVGDLVPTQGYPLPWNPLNPAANNMPSNPIVEAMVSARVAGKAKGVGDLVATGGYPIPWNPIVNGGSMLDAPKLMMADTSNALATSVASMTVGATSQLSGFDLATRANMMGMGQFDMSTLTQSVSDFTSGTTFGYPNLLVFGGLGLAAWMLFGNKTQKGTSHYSRARRALSAY